MSPDPPQRLHRQLKLFDVYVISAGAMFSSGFFLLPGIAAAQVGPAVVLAYLLCGLVMVPAMVSQAELATAMPRAGGAYYYLDRTLGPLVGTIGGFGTWMALILKSAFALIGMGAYLGIVFDVSILPTAVGFAVAFTVVNMVGLRQTTGLLRVFFLVLLAIVGFFIIHGMVEVGTSPARLGDRFTPFLPFGVDGLLGTVGLVFVSYIGLTKVASVSEEVHNPDRNIPMGMALALGTVTGIYVVGVGIMVAVLGTDSLSQSLTPVADAAAAFGNWVPSGVWVALMVTAATAAFVSMANAGILAASRYPLAMARDRLIPEPFAHVGRFHTPVPAVLVTSAVLIVFLLTLNVVEVAKLASAIQLAIFGMVNVAVIVMRESRIEAYDPGFRSPLYPWTQVVGITVPLVLVGEMGWEPVLFTLGVIAAGIAWYQYYARARIAREGAIFHVFARLGRRRFAGLDRELREIMKEKGLRAEDPFDEVVARAPVVDLSRRTRLREIIGRVSALLADRLPVDADQLQEGFLECVRMGGTPVSRGTALLHTRLPHHDGSEMALVRCAALVELDVEEERMTRQAGNVPVQAIFFVVSGEADPGRHLRILAQLAGRMDDPGFVEEWLAGADDQELKETLLRDDRFLALKLQAGTRSEPLIGRALKEIHMPEGSLVALIRRYGVTMVPRGRTVLREGDRLTIIGDPSGLEHLAQEYLDGG